MLATWIISRKALALAATCLTLLCFAAPPADAQFSITDFGAEVSSGGVFSRQAGGHPDLTTRFDFSRFDKTPNPDGSINPDGNVKDVAVNLPPGMVGNTTAVPTCPVSQLVEPNGHTLYGTSCPAASLVGDAAVDVGDNFLYPTAVFNLEHGPDVAGLFGFVVIDVPVIIEAQVRPGDYGISSMSARTSQAQPVERVSVTFWGDPGDPSHDVWREGKSSTVADVPFMRAPTSCSTSPQPFSISANSWQEQGRYSTRSVNAETDGTPFSFIGCDRLPFKPTAVVQSSSHAARSSSGLDVTIKVPQNEDPKGLATADVRKTTVTLPRGFAVNPAAANGQAGCSQAEIGIGSNDAPTCPPSSRLGTVKIKSPLLEEELEGSVYLAKQDDNPFGSLLALYIAVKGPGFYLKLPGRVDLDQSTGQVVTTFDNTPQLPFEELRLSLRGGSGAPLVTPDSCGTYNTKVEMTSWASSTPVVLDSPVVVGEGCNGGGFSPKLRAGTSNPTGGSFSPFTLQVTREDGEANLSRIQATLPEGVLAKLAGVPLCGDAQAASGDCPAGSQVGTTTVGAGVGPSPIYVPEAGRAPTAVYLAGPYKGAPYSLVVKVPAQAGPFDLGTVVVRNALRIDPTTTQVTAESDPLPQILQGIPISYRDVRVEVTRSQFTVNPTSCKQMAVTSVLTSATGQTATPSARFQAAGCGELGFGPKLTLSLKGQMKRAGDPALTATLTQPKGSDANIAQTSVMLPRSAFIDNRHVNSPCTRVQFNADACPPASILGTATAYSPLLEKPLTGPVYFRSNGGDRELPDLVADLDGQIHVTLVGFIDAVKVGKEASRVRTRFQNVPDAPVSKFVLKLKGGKKGLIQNSVNLCRSTQKATVKLTGQNGKPSDFEQKIATSCGGKKSKGKKGHKAS
jgi:hypothetical protein